MKLLTYKTTGGVFINTLLFMTNLEDYGSKIRFLESEVNEKSVIVLWIGPI